MALSTGKVIRLRHRLWRVDRITDTEFTATSLDGRDQRRWRFLRSLEEEDGSWRHEEVRLLSDSTDERYQPIVLKDDEEEALRVIAEFVAELPA